MASRRSSKDLSNEDIDLWNRVSHLVKPLSRRRDVKTIPEYKPTTSDKGGVRTAIEETPIPRIDIAKADSQAQARKAEVKARPSVRQPPRLDSQELRKLRKGRVSIDARIDLHGLSQAQAYDALVRFVKYGRAAGFARILVITGKGRPDGTADGRGVLRRVVPHWLAGSELAASIVGYEEAGLRHGGSGSLYVRLKRA